MDGEKQEEEGLRGLASGLQERGRQNGKAREEGEEEEELERGRTGPLHHLTLERVEAASWLAVDMAIELDSGSRNPPPPHTTVQVSMTVMPALIRQPCSLYTCHIYMGS